MKNICNFILFKLNRFPAAEKKKTNFHPHWSNQHLLEFLFISFFPPTYLYLTTFIPSFAMNKLSAAFNINNALKAQVALQSLLCEIDCKFLLLGHLCLFSSCNFLFFFFKASDSCSLQSNVRLLKTTAKGLLIADIWEEAHICPLGPLSCDAEAWVDEKLACFAPDQTLTLETVALFFDDARMALFKQINWSYPIMTVLVPALGLWLWSELGSHSIRHHAQSETWIVMADLSDLMSADRAALQQSHSIFFFFPKANRANIPRTQRKWWSAWIMLIKKSPSIWHSLRLTFFLRAGVLL